MSGTHVLRQIARVWLQAPQSSAAKTRHATLHRSLLILCALSGCATLAGDPAKMTAEQLKEWVKDKNANLSCGVFNSPYGRGVMTYVVLDKAVVVNGSVTVDNECRVTITNTIPATEAKEARTKAPVVVERKCYPGNADGSVVICEKP